MLGKIELANAPQFTRYAARNGEAVFLNFLRQHDASTVSLSKAVQTWLAAHRGALPADVRVEVFYDQAELIHASIGSVRDGLLIGGLLAIVIIAVFIGSVSLGAIAASVLQSRGITNIINLSGGFSAWEREGHPVEA